MLDIASGRPIGRPLSVGDMPAGTLDLSPDGRLVAAATVEGPIYVWDVKTGVPFGPPLTVDTTLVNDVAFSPDGRTLVSSHQASAVAWSMDGEQAIGRTLGGPTDLVTGMAFSADGRRLAATMFDGDTLVYDRVTRRAPVRIDGDSVVSAVAFHPDGQRVAIGTIDGRVRLFDATSGAAVGRPVVERNAVIWQVAFSPDGRLLAVAVDPNGVSDAYYLQKKNGVAELWDVVSRRRVGQVAPQAGSVFTVAFNPDGSLLATGSYRGQLDLWDVATRKHHGKAMRVTGDGVLSVAFDPSSELLAAGGANGPVRVWRVADQRPAFPPLTGHTPNVVGTAFDPDDTFLATSTLNGGTRLWDPATGLGYGGELASSPRPASLEPTIDLPGLGLRNAFSPDGKQLAVPGVDTRPMLWDVDPAVWRERACAIAGRNLSPEEWRLYMPSGTDYRATCPQWPTG
jgi:WD40 repeat protein